MRGKDINNFFTMVFFNRSFTLLLQGRWDFMVIVWQKTSEIWRTEKNLRKTYREHQNDR